MQAPPNSQIDLEEQDVELVNLGGSVWLDLCGFSSELRVPITKEGARVQGGLTPDFLALSKSGAERTMDPDQAGLRAQVTVTLGQAVQALSVRH
jgi:hypothetical protein